MTGWFDALYTSPELEGPWWRRAIVLPWRVAGELWKLAGMAIRAARQARRRRKKR